MHVARVGRAQAGVEEKRPGGVERASMCRKRIGGRKRRQTRINQRWGVWYVFLNVCVALKLIDAGRGLKERIIWYAIAPTTAAAAEGVFSQDDALTELVQPCRN